MEGRLDGGVRSGCGGNGVRHGEVWDRQFGPGTPRIAVRIVTAPWKSFA